MTTDKRKNQLVSEPNCHIAKWFSEDFLAVEINEIEVKMNNPVYLGFLTLKINKTLMYKFWYEYITPRYQQNAKLCYKDIDGLIIYIKTEDVCKDIANNVEKRFDKSNYEVNKPLPTRKNKNVIG